MLCVDADGATGHRWEIKMKTPTQTYTLVKYAYHLPCHLHALHSECSEVKQDLETTPPAAKTPTPQVHVATSVER